MVSNTTYRWRIRDGPVRLFDDFMRVRSRIKNTSIKNTVQVKNGTNKTQRISFKFRLFV